jgi:hypothetical protein
VVSASRSFAPGQNPVLTIVVIANGGSTYTIQYNSDGNVR